jgi:FAD/FMN-containing dehydrogenase
MADIFSALTDIVGKDYVSRNSQERYFYSQDPGLMQPHEPDYVVLPGSADEVQRLVKLANERKIPVVPRGGGLSLTGLAIPQRGGIVVDMRRMDRILEVNERARYAVVEGGTSEGKIIAYLQRHHPTLRHSIPDAPPQATLVGNAAIHGQGRLAQQYGFTSDMVTGLEVALPTGELCKIGSCSLSPYWFSKGPPLPDFSGLFLGWIGTSGIITKIGLKLYPRKRLRDVETFVTDVPGLIPDIVFKLTHLEMVEDINIWFQPYPLMFKGNHHMDIYITGDTDEELEFKRRMVWNALGEYIENKDGGFMWLTPDVKPTFMEMPQKSIARFADVRRGGGFQYAGPIILVEKYPACARKTEELGSKYKLGYSVMARIIGRGHCMMFGFAFTFNRADADEMDRVRKALDEAVEFSLEQGGLPWKPTVEEQQAAMDRMDPNTLQLFGKLRTALDPNGIMNPGNWEVS